MDDKLRELLYAFMSENIQPKGLSALEILVESTPFEDLPLCVNTSNSYLKWAISRRLEGKTYKVAEYLQYLTE